MLKNEEILRKQDLVQVTKDIDRTALHPVLLNPDVRAHLHSILTTFLVTSKDVQYIQGIDTIAPTLYTAGFEALDSELLEMIPSMLKQIYLEFSTHFLDPSNGQLDFRYTSMLMTRLLNFFDPELANVMKDIDHSLYLIKWFMTLFAHTLPLKVLHEHLWVDLFCERVDYLFYLALSITISLRETLLLQKQVTSKQFDQDEEEGFGLHSLAII